MMARTAKVHLTSQTAAARKRNPSPAACGAIDATRLTRDTEQVTCERCRKTVLMADMVAHAMYRRSQRGRQKG